MQQAGELAATTAKLLNVSEFSSVEEATSALVSSLQAFTQEGQDIGQRAEEIVDVLNHIGNRYPVATNELAEGLATSSAALVAANNSIEAQVALLAAGNATMQDVSAVASGLKIVAARLRGTTTDIDDDADSAVTNVSKLQAKIKALTAEANGGEGIDIINEDGSYKSTYEILSEISKIFDKMDDVSSAALLELIAGKNRSSVVAAILQNGDILEEAYADAFSSAGSSQKELDTYLDSIQGRIDKFNNSFQTMWMNTLNSDIVKVFVDIGRILVEWVDSMGLFQTLVTAVGGIIVKKNWADMLFGKPESAKVATENLKTEVNNVKQSVESVQDAGEDAFEQMSFNLDNAAESGEQLDDTLKTVQTTTEVVGDTGKVAGEKAATGFNKAKVAVGNLLKSMAMMYAISTALELVTTGIKFATERFADTSQSADALDDKFQDISDQLSNCTSELQSLESELDATNSKIEELLDQDALSFVEQEELERLQAVSAELERQISMQQTLQDSLRTGTSAAAVSAGNAYLQTSFGSKESKTQRQEEAEENWGAAGKGIGLVAGGLIAAAVAGVFTGGVGFAAALPTILAGAGIGAGAGGILGGIAGSASEGVKYDQEQTVEQAIATMNESRDKLIKARDEAYAAYVSDPTNDDALSKYQHAAESLATYDETMANHISQMSQYYNSIMSNYSNASEAQRAQMTDQMEQAKAYGDMIDKYNIEMGGVNAKDNAINRIFGTEADEELLKVKAALEEMAKADGDIDLRKAFGDNTEACEEFIDRLYDLGIYVYEVEDAFKKMNDAAQIAPEVTYTDIVQDIDNIADAINGVKDAYQEFIETGHATPDTILSLKDYFNAAGLSKEFEEYTRVMTSGTASVAEAQEATAKLAQDYIEKMISVGELTADQKSVYVTLLRDSLGITNAEDIIDHQLQKTGLTKLMDQFKSEYDKVAGTFNPMHSEFSSAEDLALSKINIEEIIEAYGLEEDAVDELITKLKEKNRLELEQGVAQDKMDGYNLFINDYKKIKEERDNAQKALDDFIKENANPADLYEYDSSTGMYAHKYISGVGLKEWEYESILSDYQRKLAPYVEAAEESGSIFATKFEQGVRAGYLDSDGNLLENAIKSNLKEAQDALDGIINEIENEFTLDYDLKFRVELDDNTISGITAAIEEYKAVLQQTTEVMMDGQVVSEEYKQSLIDLGISATELNKCFDANNPLLVTNAEYLHDLINESKKSTAQNIKLAKSHARLKYYEKYKELRKLTNGQKVSSAATLTQVKTLYLEMTTLQKTIARYSMLEHQLLGATNAYEKFADAQEIDSANDYESKAEELVNYLADAFHTAKLGTEAAQEAIKGLVPSSVYDDLDALDEKMQAVYDYFTEDLSKYFTLEFNDDGSVSSAEMLIDNVKQFVEDGIEKYGVFTGSWEEWGLDESINSLDELAEKMNVTKEVAYAFLQAMETYDISWIGGDASTLLDWLIPGTEDINNFKTALQDALSNTSIKVDVLPNVDFDVLTYQDSDGAYVNLTPVLPNGKVVDKDEFDKYVQDQLASGGSLQDLIVDGYKVYVNSYDTKDAAEKAAQQLEADIKDYQNMVKSYSLENTIYSTTQKQVELEYKIATGEVDINNPEIQKQWDDLTKEAEANADAAKEHTLAWIDANDEYEKAKERVEHYTSALAEAKNAEEKDEEQIANLEKRLASATDEMWKTYGALVKLGEPTEIVLSVALEDVQNDINTFKKTFESNVEISAVIKDIDKAGFENIGLKQNADGSWECNITSFNELDEDSKQEVIKYINYLEKEHKINALMGGEMPTVLSVLTEIKDILSKTYTLKVETDDATNKTKTFADIWNGIKDKWLKVTTSYEEEGNTTKAGRSRGANGDKIVHTQISDVNGTAHASGTAYAGGSWGADESGTSLVGEIGPEILVRGNRWTTVGENGAEFTQVKKGDIIFNHKQSEQLLKHGYVAGRGKAHAGGTAFASGTAYGNGSVHPWLGGINIDEDWDNIDAKISAAMKNAADSIDDFAETIDWIEIRMEEYEEALGLYSARLENAVDFVSKNSIIGSMMGVNKSKYADALSGAKYYEEYAEKYLKGMDKALADAVRNGQISITEYTKEADKATIDAIQKYRDYAQKAADLYQQAEEIATEIYSLAKQAIDNIATDFENKASLRENRTNQLNAYNDLLETTYGTGSEGIYRALMEMNRADKEALQKQKDAMQKELNAQVEAGNLKKYSQEWYDAVNAIAALDTEIIELDADFNNLQDSINEIHWYHFDLLMSQFKSISEEAENLIDILKTKDVVDEMGNWTDEGITALGLYAQQMEVAQKQAEQYAEQIEYLNANWKDLGYTEEEYLDKLDELKDGQYDAIGAYNDAKDAIVDLNKERVEAIKTIIEKEIAAYEELVDAKKELLDSEKSLYDFRKRTMDQQKDIADLERKLAALDGDNSASARAKRAKLEAQLAEARAELQESYYDRSVSNQQDALDKELENFQDQKDAEIESWEEYLENTEQVVQDSLDVIQSNTSIVLDTLNKIAEEYSLNITSYLTSPWESGSFAISAYQETFGNAISEMMNQLDALEKKYDETDGALHDAIEAEGQSNIEQTDANNDAYTSSEYTTPNNDVTTVTPDDTVSGDGTAKAPPAKGDSVTVKKTATHFGSKSGNAKMRSFVPGGKYTAYKISGSGDNAQVLIGKKGKYTGWVNLKDLEGYAKGATSVKKNQLAWIDELGDELQLVPDNNGRLAYIKKGTGILTADMTERLMDIAMDPSVMLDRNRPEIGLHPEVHHAEIKIDASIGELIHIDKCDQSVLPDVEKIVHKALEQHTQKLNQSLRKYVR